MAGEAGTLLAAAKPTGPAASAAEQEIVDSVAEDEADAAWKPVLGLPCELSVDLPLPSFRVADLMKLRKGSVIDTGWHLGRDVPLRLNGSLIGWSEFEVVNQRLAVRLTELA